MASITNNNGLNIINLLDDIALYKYNPSGIQRSVLDHLRAVTDGKVDIIDPTNPFVFLLESSSVNTAAAMIENAANTRRQYPSVAQTYEDIYLHMSDKDFIDRFASPAMTKFSFMIQKDDVIKKMIYDSVTDSKKVTISRNTEFVVAETTFSLQYPINIKQLTHGGLLITYDADVVSSLQTLETNNINFDIRTDSTGIEWIYFEVEVYQFKVNTITVPVSASISFNQEFELTDYYYYSRVFIQNKINKQVWDEIYTTHTDQVYDISTPTAVLKVTNKTLTISIPQIYINTNLISGTLRIDVYETKGEFSMTMENYPISSFSTKLKNLDTYKDNTIYSAAMNNVNYISYCTKTVNGGSNEISFDKLKEKVIMNSVGTNNLPITNIQIENSLEKEGYQIVKNIDVITNRVFFATKSLPIPFNEKLITAGSASIETLLISIKDAVVNQGVKNNGLRITFTPDIVYKNINGIINIYPKDQLDIMLKSSKDIIATTVSSNDFLYTPFHYVLDTSRDEFELRPYYLDKPEAQTVNFISQNETTNYQVNTQSYVITRISEGFKITIMTKSNKNFMDLNDSNVYVQLSYVPVNEVARAYLTGTYVRTTSEGERIYEFILSTNYDIDSGDNILLNNFKIFTTEDKITATKLTSTFDILYSTNDYNNVLWRISKGDYIIGKFLLPDNTINITNETIRIKFGDALKTLWARSRSVVTPGAYLKYTEDIPWLYEKDVYEIDLITGSNFSFDINGEIKYTILHKAGDSVFDSNGVQTYKHYKDETRLDNFGNPMASDTKLITRQIDMMFIEGAYYFATDYAAIKYRSDMVESIITWLTIDLLKMSQSLLEQTRLYFYPKKTMGGIKAIVNDGQINIIEAGQSFKVDLYVKPDVYKNTDLRTLLIRTTIKTIDNLLRKSTISISEITSVLRVKYGEDVVSFNIKGLGGVSNLETFTVIHDSDRCSIRKRLIRQSDGSLIVQEDIDCTFINYNIV